MRALGAERASAAWARDLEHRLAALDERSQRRWLRAADRPVEPVVERDGRRLLNLSSNNYLGLAGDPRIEEAMATAAARGAGSTASRLIVGTDSACLELERAIAAHKGTEAALVFGSGYLANVGVLSAVLERGDAAFSDRLNHASIWDGIRLSGATLHRYRHADAEHLCRMLEQADRRGSGRKLIITETVFSMDGDLAPLAEIVALAERFGAALVVDEAHAGGVFGPYGEGYAHHVGLADRIDLHIGTFGKAYGVYGAYAAGTRAWIDFLVSTSRPFIFTTALPPVVVDGIAAALGIVRGAADLRRTLLVGAAKFRRHLLELGFDIRGSTTQIVPVVVGESEDALAFAAVLEQHGVLAVAVRPPTVPPGSARLRFSLTAQHTEEQIAQALVAIEAARGELG
jgi:8-amino-7-oxononanoate synthase